MVEVTLLQLEQTYGTFEEAKDFIAELIKGRVGDGLVVQRIPEDATYMIYTSVSILG